MNDSKTFSDCKGKKGIKFLQDRFGKEFLEKESLFKNTEPLQPSPWLNETLKVTRPIVSKSEQSRSAFVISNIILEFYKRSAPKIFVYTEKKLNEYGLRGHLDYILARRPLTRSDADEYKVVIEVKRAGSGYRNFRRNFGQCMAEMIAMQCYNTKNRSKTSNVYGVLTNAEEWHFMKLTDTEFQVDTRKYQTENEIELILGILNSMIRDEL